MRLNLFNTTRSINEHLHGEIRHKVIILTTSANVTRAFLSSDADEKLMTSDDEGKVTFVT